LAGSQPHRFLRFGLLDRGAFFSAPYAHAHMIARNHAEIPFNFSGKPVKRLGDGEPFAREFLIPFSLSSKGQLLLRY
jgi:hypothetical protein